MSEIFERMKGVWIPKEIWFNEDLSMAEKILFVQIDSLDNDDGCTASNSYFGKFMSLSKERVSEIIGSLEKKGFIKSKIRKFQSIEGITTQRTLKSCIKTTMVKDPFMMEYLDKRVKLPCSGNRIPPLENGMTHSGKRFAHSENHPYINISNNLLTNNRKNIKHQYMEFVTLTTSEYFKLKDRFGRAGVRERCEALNLWKGSKGKKTASDYLTILNWERMNKSNNPPPKKYKTLAEMQKENGLPPPEERVPLERIGGEFGKMVRKLKEEK